MAQKSKDVCVDPGEGYDGAWMRQFPLATVGRHIVNISGDRFRFKGVNWYGASDSYHVVGGLDVQRLDVICATIRTLGFSVVRLPFSNEMLRRAPLEGSINLTLNPELSGKSALEVLDEVVLCLGRHSIAVVLNNHTTLGEWCGGPDKNGLWFSPGCKTYTEESWMRDWVMLATRYKNCVHVVGFDLRNEVRFCPWPLRWPSWTPSSLASCFGAADWSAAATECAERVLARCPNALIIVERVIWPMHSLRGYANSPGPLLPRFAGRLVLGVHHYSWNGPGRYLAFSHKLTGAMHWVGKMLRGIGIFSEANYGDLDRDALFEELVKQWGFLLESNTCPVWVSEFGANADEEYDMRFFSQFVAFLEAVDADWAYWPLNVGPKPASGDPESYGMLADDWTPKLEPDPRLEKLRSVGVAQHP